MVLLRGGLPIEPAQAVHVLYVFQDDAVVAEGASVEKGWCTDALHERGCSHRLALKTEAHIAVEAIQHFIDALRNVEADLLAGNKGRAADWIQLDRAARLERRRDVREVACRVVRSRRRTTDGRVADGDGRTASHDDDDDDDDAATDTPNKALCTYSSGLRVLVLATLGVVTVLALVVLLLEFVCLVPWTGVRS